MLSFKLIPAVFMLLAAIDTSLAAPSNLAARTTDGCYMVLTPNPTTDMLVSVFTGGKYKIEIKFGDGAEANTPRDRAYATTNPSFKFSYAETGSMKGCGKAIEKYALQELHTKKQTLVVPSQTSNEWYTFLLGTKIGGSREAYKLLNEQMADFGKQKFATDAEAKAWAAKFVAAIEPHLSDA